MSGARIPDRRRQAFGSTSKAPPGSKPLLVFKCGAVEPSYFGKVDLRANRISLC